MSEEAQDATEATPDTEASDAPEAPPATPVDWESEDNPYKGRYADLRPQYDQFQNVVNALSNPETQAEALRRFGIELTDGEDEFDDLDADEPMTRAEFNEYLANQRAAQEAAVAEDHALNSDTTAIAEQMEAIEKEHGELSDDELSILLPNALQNRDQDGRPMFKEAFDALTNVGQSRHKRYLETKRAARVGVGTAGTETVNLADDEQRQGLMAEVMAASREAEGS